MYRKDRQLNIQALVSTIDFKRQTESPDVQAEKMSKVSRAYQTDIRFYNNQQPSKVQSPATLLGRFKKNNNLVQTNKENIQKYNHGKMSADQYFVKDQSERKSIIAFSFKPQTEQEIRNRYKHVYNEDEVKVPATSENLQRILKKNQLKDKPCLMGYNILKLQKKYNFSRFQLHNLHSTYKTLLFNSKFSIRRFKNDFEVMLNINKIHVRPEVLQKIFRELKRMTFENFIQIYNYIDQIIYKQNIVDYIEILFESIYDKNRIRYEDIIRVLKQRLTEKESVDITSIIYSSLDKCNDDTVKLTQMTELCHNCQNFAKKIYLLYSRETKNN